MKAILCTAILLPFALFANTESGGEGAPFEVSNGIPHVAEIEANTTEEVPPGQESYLKFQAWIPAESFRGYSGAVRVFWNQKELTTARGSMLMTLQDGRTAPRYTQTSGWTLAYLENPAQYEFSKESPYYLQEELNPTAYLLRIPETVTGINDVRFEFTHSQEGAFIKVQNLQVIHLAPEEK